MSLSLKPKIEKMAEAMQVNQILSLRKHTFLLATCFLGGEKELPRRSPSRPAGQRIGKSGKRYSEIYYLVINWTVTNFGQLTIFPVRILWHRW